MKSFKFIVVFTIFATLVSSCSSAQKLQEKAPMTIGDVYFERWVAGVQGGGMGINLFIPVSKEIPATLQLDSVYFRGHSTKLELIQGENPLYVGRFQLKSNQKSDIVMSSDPNEEYGNEAPKIATKFPFELKDTECVVSYKLGNDTKYFKIENIFEKARQYYPSAPPNRQ